MLQKRKYAEADLQAFERDLLAVLKNDPDHKLDFDGKLLFRSRRHDCLLAATDVYWDKKSGDVILVGAFRSGKPVMDETKNYPVMKERVAVPFRECFEDLKMTSGSEMKLISKARKAVIDKYLNSSIRWMQSKGLVEGGILNLVSLDVGKFRIDMADVLGLGIGMEGKVTLLCSNSIERNFSMEASKIPLSEIQSLGGQLMSFQQMYRSAAAVYSEALRSEKPVSMSFSERDESLAVGAALAEVRKRNFPNKICNLIAREFTDRDIQEIPSMTASSRKDKTKEKRYGLKM